MNTIVNLPSEGFVPLMKLKDSEIYYFFFDKETVYQPVYDDEGKETGKEDTGTVNATETRFVMQNATYETMVQKCIAVKYDMNAQMALLYNYQNDSETYKEQMQMYQDWRTYCKNACKTFFNIEITLDDVKEEKIAEINKYDSSSAVNEFTYNGQAMWIDKQTRVGLVNAANAAKATGETEITVGISGISVTLPCDTLLTMLYQLEMYALECYNVTLAHKNAVEALTTIDEVEAYDYKTGYPEKLAF